MYPKYPHPSKSGYFEGGKNPCHPGSNPSIQRSQLDLPVRLTIAALHVSLQPRLAPPQTSKVGRVWETPLGLGAFRHSGVANELGPLKSLGGLEIPSLTVRN